LVKQVGYPPCLLREDHNPTEFHFVTEWQCPIGAHLPHRPFHRLRQLQPVFQPEPDSDIALYNDFVNQLAEQLLIEGFQRFRTGFYCIQQLFGIVEDTAILLPYALFFLLLGVADGI
jgi:hypothetical protein